MSRAMQEVAALRWTPLSHGRIAISSRPSLKTLSALKEATPCTSVFSLLHADEDLPILEHHCAKLALAWINVQIRGANKHSLRTTSVLETIQRGLREAQGRLAAGEALFIHCAGGVHRTGFFTYALLRLEGLSRAGAFDAIREMRLRTYQSCGQFRYELAEKLVQNMKNGAQIDISSANSAFQDCLQSEFVRGEEIPLLWIDMSLVSDQEIAISVNITNGLMTKVIEGPNFTSLIPNFSHQISSEWLQTHLKTTSFPIPSKSASESEAELMDFLESSAEPQTCKLASYYAYFDAEVLEEFFPRVYAFLHYRVVDLSTFAVLSKEKIALEEPPIAFLRRMQGLLFEKAPREVQFERPS